MWRRFKYFRDDVILLALCAVALMCLQYEKWANKNESR
jgi:hypothetical protein